MLLSAHEEYIALLNEARVNDDEWFDKIDNQVFSFKKKITYWLKNDEEDNKSKGSSGSTRSSGSKTSKRSKTLRESRSSKGSKLYNEKELEDKIRVGKLAAEAELLVQKQMIEFESQKLKIREEFGKARVRVSACDELKFVSLKEAIIHREK